MQKMIWTPSESMGANSETPNHAFVQVPICCSLIQNELLEDSVGERVSSASVHNVD
jgi:hypothetical protein